MWMRVQKQSPLRSWRTLCQGIGVLVYLTASVSTAHAHGGMAGPDELGPPLFTSAALAFVCYWLVILWPSSRNKNGTNPQSRRKTLPSHDRLDLSRPKKRVIQKRISQARKVANQHRLRNGSGLGRKTSDA